MLKMENELECHEAAYFFEKMNPCNSSILQINRVYLLKSDFL